MNEKNPYQTTFITEPSAFYGRSGEVTKIYNRIGADRPQNVSVVGRSKMGKSSLLSFLCHPETQAKHLPNPETSLFFLMRVKEHRELTPDKFFQLFVQWWGDEKGLDSEPTYDGLKNVIERLHQNGERLIFFLDDFEAITQNPDFPLQFFSFLRSMSNNYNVAYITTSHQNLQTLCISKEVGESPFFNIFTNLPLRAFKEPEAKQLIADPSAKAGVSLKDESDFILEIAGCFPFPLQTACRILFEMKAEAGKLRKGALKAAKDRFFDDVRPYYEALWMALGNAEQSICRKFLAGAEIERPEEYLVRELIRHDYVVQKEGQYDFFSSTFKRFVGEQFGIEVKEQQERKGLFSFLRRKQ